ncbi:MAG TPA: hypothetical protein DCP78_10155 [Sphingobacterium sp.]|nr:hypothetical protein [Sphingobacterium sp.]
MPAKKEQSSLQSVCYFLRESLADCFLLSLLELSFMSFQPNAVYGRYSTLKKWQIVSYRHFFNPDVI